MARIPCLILISWLATSITGQLVPLSWMGPRAAVVRDSLFFDGGFLKVNSSAGGSLNGAAQSQLNFSTPFNSTSNFRELMLPTNTTPSDITVQPHFSGFMFADNNEWYSFGGQVAGLALKTVVTTAINWFGAYQPNIAATGALHGLITNWNPPAGNYSNLHVTNGAGVSIPSESLGFYFGGLQSPNGSDMSYSGTKIGLADFPSQPVNTMLMVNSASYQNANWSQIPLPNGTTRAEATLAWVPVGSRGAVIVMGGVSYPADVFGGANCILGSNYTDLNSQAASYMTNLSIYDVNSGSWYSQTTNGASPPQLAQACAVVASAPDNSSHNIYVYGGYAGGLNRSTASDDVWILSVPSFTWIQVASNDSNHGRTNHVCAKPYPDQMMVVGGTTGCGKSLNGTFADVFNLTSLTWTGKYHPSIWSQYSVPASVSSAIAGVTASNMNTGLQALFKSAYPGKQPQYYPYSFSTSNSTTNGTNTTVPAPPPTPPPPKNNSHWIIPVAVVVPIVSLILIVLVAWFCIRRNRKDITSQGRRQSRVAGWLHGQPEPKSIMSEDETTQIGSSPGLHEISGDNYFKSGAAELNSDNPGLNSALASPIRHPYSPGSNTASAELHSHSVPAELPTEMRGGFVPITPVIRNHHMYPPSLGRHDSSNQSRTASSPEYEPINPYKLPQNRSKEKVLTDVPDDMILDQVQSRSPRIVPATLSPKPSRTVPSAGAGDVSPELKTVEHTDIPITPPQQHKETVTNPISGMTHRPSHTRNVSSMSSGITDFSSTSPVDKQKRFMAISPITGSPNTTRSTPSPMQQSFNTAVTQENPSTVGLGIKRKEVSTTSQNTSAPDIS